MIFAVFIDQNLMKGLLYCVFAVWPTLEMILILIIVRTLQRELLNL